NSVVLFSGSPDPAFYELVSAEAASTVEPGRADKVTLYARPTREFPENAITAAQSNTIEIFYDTQSITGDVAEYRLALGIATPDNDLGAGYFFRRRYTRSQAEQMRKEIVPGVYQFTFPSIGLPDRPLYLSFPVRPTVEGWVK